MRLPGAGWRSAKTTTAKMQTARKKSVAKAAVTKPSGKVARGIRVKNRRPPSRSSRSSRHQDCHHSHRIQW